MMLTRIANPNQVTCPAVWNMQQPMQAGAPHTWLGSTWVPLPSPRGLPTFALCSTLPLGSCFAPQLLIIATLLMFQLLSKQKNNEDAGNLTPVDGTSPLL